jgi:CRP-like cAMP-binding protein
VNRNGQQLARLRLLDIEPDLGRFLTAEDRAEAGRMTVPILIASPGKFDLEVRLREAGAFGAILVGGLLTHRLVFGDHPALRLLGPGDVLAREGDAGLGPITASSYQSPGELRLALLDDRVLAATQRFPRLVAGLHVRMGEQHHRLATQLVICQLPRVEERILGMLWLLAETWGRVTPNGTTLPVALTHDALGACVGARRPTVSLALKELSDRGAILRQSGGWVLLEPLPGMPEAPETPWEPGVELGEAAGHVWDDMDPHDLPAEHSRDVEAVLAALRESHSKAQRDVTRQLAESRDLRARNVALRAQVATARRRRRPAP